MIEQHIVPVRRPYEHYASLENSLYPPQGTELAKCPMSLDLSTKRGRYLLMAAGNPGDIEFDKNGVCVVIATDWLIYPESREDPETGEISEFARTCLFTADGDVFRTTSAHAPSRIKAALQACPPEEWAKGIPFLIRERKSKQGRTYHDIRLDGSYLRG